MLYFIVKIQLKKKKISVFFNRVVRTAQYYEMPENGFSFFFVRSQPPFLPSGPDDTTLQYTSLCILLGARLHGINMPITGEENRSSVRGGEEDKIVYFHRRSSR